MTVDTFPWERRREIGVFRAFAENLRESVRAPSRFYAHAPRDASPWPAIAYGYVFELTVALATFAYSKAVGEAALHDALAPLAPQIEDALPGAIAKLESLVGVSAIASLVLSPFMYLAELFAAAAVTWVGLRLARGLRTSFGHIVRLCAYTEWVRVFALLGVSGDLVPSLVSGLLTLGFASYAWVALVRSSQGIDTQRAIVASIYGTLVALAVGCVCFVPPAIAAALFLASQLGLR